MFKLINFIHPLNKLISNVMPATGLKKCVRGQQRAEKARNSEMIQLGEHLATNVLWAKAHLKRTVSKWKSDLLSDESKFDKLDTVSSGLKRRETFQRVISVQFKSQHL